MSPGADVKGDDRWASINIFVTCSRDGIMGGLAKGQVTYLTAQNLVNIKRNYL